MDKAIIRGCHFNDISDDVSVHQGVLHNSNQQCPENFRIETMKSDDHDSEQNNNTYVTLRPPRALKPPSVSHSSRGQHRESPSQFRSSSQPRASMRESATVSSSHSRSASQPRASQSHFLRGFNVANCFDVRSIPDPPSPPQQRSRHRLSIPAMIPKTSLEDVTNQGTHKEIDDLGTMKSNASRNRKRKSLAGFPSPMMSPMVMEQRDEPVAYGQGREENNHMEVRPRKLQIELCLEDSEEEGFGDIQSRAIAKRHKKRQSMVIPSQLTHQEDVTGFLETSSSSHGLPSTTQDGPSKIERFFPGDMKSLKELRNLVHGYCELTEEERVSSKEAKLIRETTGYALLSSTPEEFANRDSSSQAILANRRLVLQKISPVMMQMEKRKGRETTQWERDTGCRVEKSARSGKYKYYCIESNQKVGTQEYKKRYMSIIEGRECERKAWSKAWMDKLFNSINFDESKEPDVPDAPMVDSCALALAEPYQPQAFKGPFQNGTVFHHDFIENEARQREAFLPPLSNLSRSSSTACKGINKDGMELCDSNTGIDGWQAKATENINVRTFSTPSELRSALITLSTSEREGPAEISEASSQDTDESLDSRSSSPDLVAGSNLIAADVVLAKNRLVLHHPHSLEAECQLDVAAHTKTPHLLTAETIALLPFPDRDVESVDPDIAQAERRLWGRIDEALQEYSDEVMMIIKSKQAGKGELSTSTFTVKNN